MNIKKGIERILLFLSIGWMVYASILCIPEARLGIDQYLGLFLVWGIMPAIGFWILYFIIRWIIAGFKGNQNKKNIKR